MKDQAAEALAPGAIRLVTAPMPPEEAARLRAVGLDAQGTGPELAVSDGTADPCRCRLTDSPGGRAMLILAHRPWARTDPYAETGPTFLCAEPCAPRRPDALPGALPEAPV